MPLTSSISGTARYPLKSSGLHLHCSLILPQISQSKPETCVSWPPASGPCPAGVRDPQWEPRRPSSGQSGPSVPCSLPLSPVALTGISLGVSPIQFGIHRWALPPTPSAPEFGAPARSTPSEPRCSPRLAG